MLPILQKGIISCSWIIRVLLAGTLSIFTSCQTSKQNSTSLESHKDPGNYTFECRGHPYMSDDSGDSTKSLEKVIVSMWFTQNGQSYTMSITTAGGDIVMIDGENCDKFPNSKKSSTDISCDDRRGASIQGSEDKGRYKFAVDCRDHKGRYACPILIDYKASKCDVVATGDVPNWQDIDNED